MVFITNFCMVKKRVMSEKDHLFALIQSMKKTEKAYFKKIKSSFGNEDSWLLKLFDLFIKHEEGEEEKIIKELDNKASKDWYSIKKHTLYNELLDVLVFSKSKNTDVLWQINRLISHALYLKEKLLFDDAIKILQKTYKIALENEFFLKQAEINQQMIEILHQQKSMTDFAFVKTIEIIRLDNLRVAEQQVNAEKYFILSDTIFNKGEMLRLTSNELMKDELKVLYKNELLSGEEKALSKTALVCFHFIQYIKHCSYEMDLKKACYHLQQLIDIQETLKRFPLRARVVQMANFVRMALEAKLLDNAFVMLERMKKCYEAEKDNFVLITYLVHQNWYYVEIKDLNGYTKFHSTLEPEFQDSIEKMPFNKEILDWKHAQFNYHFKTKKFKLAYKISNFLDSQYNLHSFKNGKLYEKLLKVICAHEMNEHELMQGELRAIKYLLKSIADALPIELYIFNTLEKLAKASREKDKDDVLKEFLKEYEKHHSPDKFSFMITGFGFIDWVEAKLAKVDFLEYSFRSK